MDTLTKRTGEKFKHLLECKNVTQEEAANLLSVDERTIRRWIKDGIDRISTLEEICKIFCVDVIEVFFTI